MYFEFIESDLTYNNIHKKIKLSIKELKKYNYIISDYVSYKFINLKSIKFLDAKRYRKVENICNKVKDYSYSKDYYVGNNKYVLFICRFK